MRQTSPKTRPTLARLIAAVTALVLAIALPGAPAARASTVDPSLAPTPYQGWNTYYGLGGDFTEAEVLEMARSMVDRGLLAAGYDIIWLDGGWQAATLRDADGNLATDTTRFPHGFTYLTDTLHGMGFRVGTYTDAGAKSDACGVASGGGYQQRDADQFAAWGFDAIKVDFVCGWGNKEVPQPAFRAMIEAIRNNASGRPMIVNLCNPVTSPYWGDYPEHMQSTGSWAYAPQIAESWRTYTDVGWVGSVLYSDVLRNYDANARHPEVAGPGHWNDPDYLGPQLGMSDTEFRTQMTLWTVAAAPLVIASDVRTLSATSVATLTDRDVLAVNQDRLGDQAVRVSPAGQQEVWVKKLADGDRAVVLLNRSGAPAEVRADLATVGLAGQRARVTDLWAKTTSEASGTLRATVDGHGATLLRVEPAAGRPGESRVVAGQPTVTAVDGVRLPTASAEVLVAPGSTIDVTVPIHNDGTLTARDVSVAVRAPQGWTVTGNEQPRSLPPGRAHTVVVRITVPAGAPLGAKAIEIVPTVEGAPRGAAGTVQVVVAPQPPTGTANLAHHPWVSGTSGWMQPTIDRSVGGWTPLLIAGRTFATGVGVASPSELRWFLGARCTRLTGAAGIDDAVKFNDGGGTVTFHVEGDGRTLWQSDIVRRDQLVSFDVDVRGVRDLRLRVGIGGDHTYNDRADWVDLRTSCG